MTILSTLGFRANVSLDDVTTKGISGVSQEDIQYATRLGYVVKLLGIAERQDDFISVGVQPTMIKQSHPIASVNGVFNAVYVHGEAVGETMFYGPGAGEMPTATSVVADLVAVIKNMKLGVNGRQAQLSYNVVKLKTDEQIASKFFLLLHVDDRAGVLAQIAQVVSDWDVSIESVMQPSTPNKSSTEIIIITHEASKAAMNKVLIAFESLTAVRKIKSVYRVEG
jgi:homoserine dehydrogenase